MQAVLLLNADFRPLCTLSPRHAAELMLRGCVETVESGNGSCEPARDAGGKPIEMHSAHNAIQLPCILRLRRYVNVPRIGITWTRHDVKKRDNYTCIYCGIKLGSSRSGHEYKRVDFTVDHILPRTRGGQNTWGNTACACLECNSKKGARTPNEAGMRLLWEPKTPRVDYIVIGGDVPEPWKIYIQT